MTPPVALTLYQRAKAAGISPAELATMTAIEFAARVAEQKRRKGN